MMIDHHEFIKRQQTSPKIHPFGVPKCRSQLLCFLLFVIFMVVMTTSVGVYLYPLMVDNTYAFILFIACFVFISSFFSFLMLSRRNPSQEILQKVIEGSRGARLIVDSVNRTVYTNQNFDDFCQNIMDGESSPSFESFLKVFEDTPESKAHIMKLMDDTRRGLTDRILLSTIVRGTPYTYRIMAQSIPDWAGYIHWRIDDVTDKQYKHRMEQEERNKLIDFTDNAPVGFYSTDEN